MGQLAGRYHRREFPTWRAWWFRSGTIGRWQMQGTLLVAADERGLWLAWGLPFLRSCALHVPWSEVEVSEREALLWLSVTELRFPAVSEALIVLSGRWQQALASASGGQPGH